MIGDYVTSGIRTLVPYLVAYLLSLPFAGPILTAVGWDSATAEQRLDAAFVFVVGTLWYLLARALEKKWPKVGVLLGIPAKPTYTAVAAPAAAAPAPVVVPADDAGPQPVEISEDLQ